MASTALGAIVTTAASLPTPAIRFGVFELDTASGELRKAGVSVHLRPQASKVLAALAKRPGELVTRDQLRQEIWGSDRFVDFDHGLNLCILQVREALGDDAASPRYIQTLSGRGYRFIAPVAPVSPAVGAGVVPVPQPGESRQRTLPQRQFLLLAGGIVVLAVVTLLALDGTLLLLRDRAGPHSRLDWVQITDLPDSVSQPALSPDGRMLTFVRGPDTFAGPGQIYVKMLPDGEPVELTHDNLGKMSPVFSPDGTRVAYTSVPAENHWDTWIVAVLGGHPHLWLPNASGLVWARKGRILFSEIKDNDIHMGIVAADESRANERDIYLPASERGMAHRSYLSPDGKWALVVEMDHAVWLPCRLVSMDGTSPGRQVGPAGGGCTFAAWSPDGEWMYLNSSAGGTFHIWRQRFPGGQAEQITSGPTQEEGIALAPDGRSLITAVGLKKSAVWIHDAKGERQVSLEGYSYDPKFSRDGKKLCYRVLKGALPLADPSELRVVDLDSGRNEALLPRFGVFGPLDGAYDISQDGKKVVVSALDREGKSRLWMAPLDRQSPPHQIPNVEGRQPKFGPSGEILFWVLEGSSGYVYGVHEDGTELHKVFQQPVARIYNVSRNGEWLLAKLPSSKGSITAAFPVQGGPAVSIFAGGKASDANLNWSPDGRSISISFTALLSFGRTYFVPLPPRKSFPTIPPGGFRTESEIAKLPGIRVADAFDVAPGATPGQYAFARETVQRNLYRIPLP